MSAWERLYRIPLLRKGLILLVLAVIWESYGRWLDNPLLFTPFSAMLDAFVTDIGSGIIPGRTLVSLQTLVIGYALGILLAAARLQLAQVERLHDVVVGAEIEQVNLRVDLGPCRRDQNGRPVPLAAQLAEQGLPIRPRPRHVEEDELVRLGAQQFVGLRPSTAQSTACPRTRRLSITASAKSSASSITSIRIRALSGAVPLSHRARSMHHYTRLADMAPEACGSAT